MEITVRSISKGDAPKVAELCRQLGYSMSIEQTVQNITAVIENKDHDAFAAIKNNNIIGWIGVSYSIQVEVPVYCEIHGLVIDEKFRNHGVGKILIEKAKQWSREKGCSTLGLHCNVIRTETHRFYEHLGFKEVKQQKVYQIEL